MSEDLLLAFDSESPEFVRGFEVGRIWEMLDSGSVVAGETVHATNAEMLLRIGESLGIPVTAHPLDEPGGPWIVVTFGVVAE
jgi:hypothetical protein